MNARPYSHVIETLRGTGLLDSPAHSPGLLLFDGGHRHVTAECLHADAQECAIQVSATVYNTLNQFTEAGLLREIVVDSHCCYFDTNTENHHHFFCEETNSLKDIPSEDVVLLKLPEPPAGKPIKRVDVVLRI